MKKFILLFSLSVLVISTLSGQQFDNQIEESQTRARPRPEWRKRVFFGGIFALQFGTITAIEASPLVGYRVARRVAVAGGIKYEYFSDKRYTPEFNTHIYGLRTFVRYHLIPNLADLFGGGVAMGIYLQTEYEGLSLERQYFDYPSYQGDGRFWLHSALVGGGISIPTGQYGAFNLSVLYNLNETINSIYSNPVIRIGFNF